MDIDSYLQLVETVKESMENANWLGDFSIDDYRYLLNHGSMIYGAYYADLLVGSFMLIPATEKDIQKFNLSQLDCRAVADYGPQMVHPDYRGNKIQSLLLRKIDEVAKKQGYNIAVTTIHPDNIYSINNILSDGFIKFKELVLRRGKRNLYIKKL